MLGQYRLVEKDGSLHGALEETRPQLASAETLKLACRPPMPSSRRGHASRSPQVSVIGAWPLCRLRV